MVTLRACGTMANYIVIEDNRPRAYCRWHVPDGPMYEIAISQYGTTLGYYEPVSPVSPDLAN